MPTYKNIGKTVLIVDNLCNYRFEVGENTPTKYPHTPIVHPDLLEIDENPIFNPVMATHIPTTQSQNEVITYDLNEYTYQLELWNNTNSYFNVYFNSIDNTPPRLIYQSISGPTYIPVEKVSSLVCEFPSIVSDGDIIITEIRTKLDTN